MSNTTSSLNEWVQFHHYQQFNNPPYGQEMTSSINATTPPTIFGGHGTVTAPTTVRSPSNTNTNPANSQNLNPEGRVSKPIRRRSRASRKTPTTLLNTDTTNFRAMVQQFTGGTGTVPFASGTSYNYGSGATHMNFSHPIRTTAVVAPASGYNVMQFQHQHQHQPQPQPQQQHIFSVNSNSSIADDHGFFQRLSTGNTRPTMEVADNIGGAALPLLSARPSSSSSNDENYRSNIRYMF